MRHLKVSRQREEFAKEKALRLIQSNDLVAYEDLKVKNLVRNQKLAKSINDAAWSQLRKWIEYFGLKYGRLTIAVPPHYTTSDCPSCGKRVLKSLSTRTHVCDCGIPTLDRDYAASLNILKKATQGHWGSWSNEILDLNAWGDSTQYCSVSLSSCFVRPLNPPILGDFHEFDSPKFGRAVSFS